MEETNYHRESQGVDEIEIDNHDSSRNAAYDTEANAVASIRTITKLSLSNAAVAQTAPKVLEKRKSYYDKLKLFSVGESRYPNRWTRMILRPLIFLSFPIIFYAGFSYGSSLIWFNVLNGTASFILSKAPYGFSSSIVGLAYLSPFVGMTLG